MSWRTLSSYPGHTIENTDTNAHLGRIEALLKAAVSRGELPGGFDVPATALALKALIVGLNSMSKVLPDRSALWPAARTTLASFGLLCEDAELEVSSPINLPGEVAP